jgi:hypothetical protein
MKLRYLSSGAYECFGEPMFVAPASRRLIAFAVVFDVGCEFVAASFSWAPLLLPLTWPL